MAEEQTDLSHLSITELTTQPQGDYYGDHPRERDVYEDHSYFSALWVDQLGEHALRALVECVVRCPVAGCLLAEVFRLPTHDGQRYLGIVHRGNRNRRPGLLNWAFSDGWEGSIHWFEATCKHGNARLNRHWLLDCVGAIHVWKHMIETREDFLAKLPAEQAKGRERRVFHPPADVWRPKGR